MPLTGGGGAAECRSAISRAYYAAYLVGVAYLDRMGFSVANNHQSHVAVQRGLNNSGNATLRVASADLITLHVERRRADYDTKDRRPESVANAEVWVKLAAKVIAELDRVRDSASLDEMGAIAKAISDWVKMTPGCGLEQKSGSK